MNRRRFLKQLGVGTASALIAPRLSLAAKAGRPAPRLNVLLFTADDLACDSVGCFGGRVPGLTPNLDAFAAQGMRFESAHVNVAICQPSRGVLATGRYSHNSGILGFMHTDRDIPTVMETLRDVGYLTGILGKVTHSTPKGDYRWDFAHDQQALGNGRDPEIYYARCREFFARCRAEGKPFYFMVNSHDPHRPFHVPGRPIQGAKEPSRTYASNEVVVPGFVPDLPEVRRELSYYQNSARRLDGTFGRTMQALAESGLEADTLVMFLSDNGIAIPFAKCNAYLAGTHTPWIVRWPGVVKPGAADRDHFISGVDFFPTVLDAAGLPAIDGLDGSSFLPLLRGQAQEGRQRVFTQIDMKAGGDAVPMRCVQDHHFGYIFSPWSDGTFWYRNNNEGLTMKAMVEAAKTDPAIARRVTMYRYRALEELYDLKADPDCLNNLLDDPAHNVRLAEMRGRLHQWMQQTRDPLLPAFESRNDPDKLKAVLTGLYGENYTRPAKGPNKTSRGDG